MTDEKSARRSRSKDRPWNGRDFYVALGRAGETHRWLIAHKYGMLNAEHGSQYWQPLRKLSAGKRVFAYVAGAGS